ncbi:Type IV fimbrial assembly, ATPase PilB [hydrothermal vent metagenome]|uniref:Type IV fimbrial assembly, ATPase PilB n=1 Tax=hydrothermal vent metagenome TaxID=652676 RepID=A0A1W1EIC8_9ZZZZ
MGVTKNLEDILLDNGACSHEDISQAYNILEEYGGNLGNILLNLGVISEETLIVAQAKQYNLGLLKEFDKKPKYISTIPKGFLLKHNIFPIDEDENVITLALHNPLQLGAISTISQLAKKRTKILIASNEELNDIKELYEEGSDDDEREEIFEDEIDKLKELASEAPVIKLINNIFTKASQRFVSDIHFESFAKGMKIRYRLDGILKTVDTIPMHIKQAVTARLKLISKMNIAESRLPQDGRITIKVAGEDIDIRASSVPTAFGESFVLRLLSKDSISLEIDKLGLHSDNLNLLKSLLSKPNGILLTTGPTGSGKTSTLYACLNYIHSDETKIITVEDPVEYQLEGISQIQVKESIDYTFAKALRSILRQDPDTIMIGEIRDSETAQIAVQSALTGHLVLSTLHTNSALGAISRLSDIGIEYYLLKSSIIGLMAQRLVRRLCEECKEPFEITEDINRLYNLDELSNHITSAFNPCKAVGCKSCQYRGYKGRLPVIEIVPFDDKLMAKFDENLDFKDIKSLGYRDLKDDGLLKFLEGKTSLDEVLRIS